MCDDILKQYNKFISKVYFEGHVLVHNYKVGTIIIFKELYFGLVCHLYYFSCTCHPSYFMVWFAHSVIRAEMKFKFEATGGDTAYYIVQRIIHFNAS